VPTGASLRERRRESTLAEIKQAAMAQLAAAGPEGLSLRAVAREVGVSVQALYHYFDSRDALVTALVADAHDALADAVAEEADRQAAATATTRIVECGLAYRRWAVDHRGQFLLIYGVPLPDYAAPEDGPTSAAAARLGVVMRHVVFHDWSGADLERLHLPADAGAGFAATLERLEPRLGLGLPPGAMAAFLGSWGQLHGLVMLEVLGHLRWLEGDAEGLYRVSLQDLTARLEHLRTGGE
jgi:AcrR family transcriptional regulator